MAYEEAVLQLLAIFRKDLTMKELLKALKGSLKIYRKKNHASVKYLLNQRKKHFHFLLLAEKLKV